MPTESFRFLILVSIFGVLGVLSRVFTSSLFDQRSSAFPTATFLINMMGSFLIGFLFYSKVLSVHFQPDVQKAVIVGLLGGFTTFSAFSLESLILLRAGEFGMAGFYLIASPIVGLACAYLGLLCGSRFF